MKIYVLSRFKMETLLKSKNFSPEKFNFISIVNHDASWVFPPSTPHCVLNLRFSDVEPHDKKENEILFTEDHAREIILFLNEMDKTKDLIVHCHAGISRSGAVGDFARVKFKIPFEEFMVWNPQIQPNRHILKVLFQVQDEVYFMDSFEDWI